jgi:hypothetical protein
MLCPALNAIGIWTMLESFVCEKTFEPRQLNVPSGTSLLLAFGQRHLNVVLGTLWLGWQRVV